MLNTAIIMGRLTRDPELRRTQSGKPVAGFTVAVDRDFAPEGQEKETDFIDCVAWNGTAEFVQKYFAKGSMIVVRGRLQIRGWTDKDGNKRRTAEIIADNVYFGESKKQQEGGSTSRQNASGGYSGQTQQSYGGYTGPQPGYGQPQQNLGQPQYSQQGFGGYPPNTYQGQSYQSPQGGFPVINGDDPRLPF